MSLSCAIGRFTLDDLLLDAPAETAAITDAIVQQLGHSCVERVLW